MSSNEFGFPTSGNAADKIGHREITNTALSATLPEKALERLSYFMAWRVIGSGHLQGYLSNANGELARFHKRIDENYRAPWDAVQANLLMERGGERTLKMLELEHRSLEHEVSIARLAEKYYAADTPMSRGALRVICDMASGLTRFANRARKLTAVEDVSPGKQYDQGRIDAIRAALAKVEDRKDAIEMALPPFEDAWAGIESDLNSKAAAPHVSIHPRFAPEQAPRELPPMTIVETLWPQAGKLHASGPGSQIYIEQPDALGILLGLFKDEIAAKLKSELEAKYSSAQGQLILSQKERREQLNAVRAEHLELERKEASLFWRYVEQHGGAAPDWIWSDISPAAILGVSV